MQLRVAVILAGCCLTSIQAHAEPRVSYTTEAGYDTNYFSDTNNVGAFSLRSTLSFEGELEREETKFGYSFNHQEVLVPRYRFADEHNSWINFSLSQKLSDRLEWQMQMRGTRSDAGDIFEKSSEGVIGFRQLDHKLDVSSSVTLAALGGRNSLAASYTSLMKGKARFKIDGIPPFRLEANEALLGLKFSHIRDLAGGEIGATVAYNQSLVPETQRDDYGRYPATNLRGSLAFGRKFADRLTVLAEAGLTTISGDEIGKTVERTRPYLRAEAELKFNENLSLISGYTQDYAIYDLDDAIAEFQHRWRLAMKAKLTERLDADIALERARREWIYYDDETIDRRLVATLAFDAGKSRKLEVEFTRRLSDSMDPNNTYSGSSIATRFSGAF
ncbi:hypothetical protein [Agrobacterium larrymoorei]|uniref:Outer membrane beta-barrel protein n=1 Tax=Agrobacterium larrymoorei TaxID=160699 RepID=A0A4D7DRQ6_9HYPH|nr:hypothetical protein [Agrobacterium larrymoorei]QCI96946.1 hypothetical protein CFBP5473_02870 [Agrobacterium larrymoorei]QYA07626.1 hypothetical protein J5285_02520 [Agrobacterium larrymoorei]